MVAGKAPKGGPGWSPHALFWGWRSLVRLAPAWGGIALVWSLSILLLFRPELSACLFPLAFLSALFLALGMGREKRLFFAALAFFLVWSSLRMAVGYFLPQEGGFSPLRLGCFVFLGLHLFLAWTPLELARAVHGFFRPFLGFRAAAMAAVSVMALSKALPWVLTDASELRRTIARRCPGLSFRTRLGLLGQALVRLSLRRSGDLGRALTQRQGALLRRA